MGKAGDNIGVFILRLGKGIVPQLLRGGKEKDALLLGHLLGLIGVAGGASPPSAEALVFGTADIANIVIHLVLRINL
jgi:hypothetical protein